MAASGTQAMVSDEALAETVKRRDRDAHAAHTAFEHLYDRHARVLLAFLASKVPAADLGDVHQTVWQIVWERLPDQFHGGNFRAWLFQIARNQAIDWSRKKRPILLDEQPVP